MSDAEEPPTKMSKYEEYLEEEEEGLEEGQEEWLSEGVLTDDDYHIPTVNQEKSDSNHVMSQEEQEMMANTQEVEMLDQSNDQEKENNDQNIEDTLTNLDGRNGLSEDLDTFLIRKTDGKPLDAKPKEEKEPSKIKEEDDGNDTDDLLRLLEDDQQVKKKAIKLVKSEKMDDQGTTDDDEFIYEKSKVKTLRLAKNALIKRVATKAVPENMSDTDDETDGSTDEGVTVKRMFGMKHANMKSGKTKEGGKKVIKHVVQVNTNFNKIDKPNQPQQKPLAKPNFTKSKMENKNFKMADLKTPSPFKPMEKNVSKIQKTIKTELKEVEEKNLKQEELDEIIDGEEFLEEDDFDLDEEEFVEDLEGENSTKQRIMKPEMMDEEVPSDEDSHSEDGSLYDELPSSDSEDFDDWFTLDIRAERASDYLPLLGGCAKSLLTAEKRRAASKVSTLRRALSALTDSARRQADTLRNAAMALAEIDDTLRAA